MSDTVKFLKAIFLSMSSVKDINNPSINKMLTDFSSAIESVEKLEADKQALEDRVRELENPWISVGELLPRYRERVLLRITVGDRFNIQEGYYKGDNQWVDCWCGTISQDSYPITHWMNLPIKPQTDR